MTALLVQMNRFLPPVTIPFSHFILFWQRRSYVPCRHELVFVTCVLDSWSTWMKATFVSIRSHRGREGENRPTSLLVPGLARSRDLWEVERHLSRETPTVLSLFFPASRLTFCLVLAYWFRLQFSPLHANWLVAAGQPENELPRLVPTPATRIDILLF